MEEKEKVSIKIGWINSIFIEYVCIHLVFIKFYQFLTWSVFTHSSKSTHIAHKDGKIVETIKQWNYSTINRFGNSIANKCYKIKCHPLGSLITISIIHELRLTKLIRVCTCVCAIVCTTYVRICIKNDSSCNDFLYSN